jgi:tetratricopeptide (TPR) repeat protein
MTKKQAAPKSPPASAAAPSPQKASASFATPAPARSLKGPALLAALAAVGGAVAFFALREPLPAPYVPPEVDALSADLRTFVRKFADAATAAPRDAVAARDYALCLYFNELTRASLPNFVRLARLTPKSPLPVHYQAHCYRRFGDQETAARLYDEVVRAFPDFAPAYYERGRLALERDEWDAAERDFARARDLEPRKFDGWLGLGDVAGRRGDYETARVNLERAEAIDPKDKVVQYQLGLALRGLGRAKDAEIRLAAGSGSIPKKMSDDWSREEGRFSRSVSNVTSTAIHYIQTGRQSEGLSLLEGIYAANSDDVELLNNLASAYQDTKQPQKAVQLLEKALAKEPMRDATLVNLASLYVNLGDYKKALEFAERALKSNPRFAPAFFNRGNALARLGRPAEAVVAYREAVRFDPKNGKVRCALASVLLGQRKLDDARREGQRGLEIEPDYIPGWMLLIEICAHQNDRPGAEAAYAAAKGVAPDHPDVVKTGQKFGLR